MVYLGIDIGSTAAKIVLLDEQGEILHKEFSPTGFNSNQKAIEIKENILSLGYDERELKVVATGYGRISVPYAHKKITEISCHAKG